MGHEADARAQIRSRYAAWARAAAAAGGRQTFRAQSRVYGARNYGGIASSAPIAALMASLGIGNPVTATDLQEGETNGSVNLAVDKTKVFHEMFRVLRAGGRIALADVVVDAPPAGRTGHDLALAAGFPGALTREAYRAGLESAGFEQVATIDSHRVAEGVASAIVQARKPDPSAVPVRRRHDAARRR